MEESHVNNFALSFTDNRGQTPKCVVRRSSEFSAITNKASAITNRASAISRTILCICPTKHPTTSHWTRMCRSKKICYLVIVKVFKNCMMPFQVPSLFRTWTGNVFTFLNFSIVACTIIESYLFPFAVIKWMILVTKYGGLLNLINSCKLQPKTQTRSRYEYKYSLQLMTSCRRNRVESELTRRITSQVSMVMEADDNAHKWIQLSYCGQDCKRIPPALWKMYGAKVQHLDLSYNNIETLKGLEQFARLEELILDNNKLGDHISLPELPYLKTLSLNNNQISDLEGLINKIDARYPALTYLSLLSNKACPNQLSDIDKDESDYQRYRYFVIYKLPSLRFLDSRRVSSSERREAMTRGEFMRVRRPPCDVIDTPRAAPPSPKEHVRPLHVDLASLGKHRGAYGKCSYKYTGKHSEGNRFIVNSDL